MATTFQRITSTHRRGTPGPVCHLERPPSGPLQVVELVMEVLLLKQHSIEQRLKVLFTEGDHNGDGVLSFEEFNGIVSRCGTATTGGAPQDRCLQCTAAPIQFCARRCTRRRQVSLVRRIWHCYKITPVINCL